MSRVESLTLDLAENFNFQNTFIEEQTAEAVNSFELPESLPTTDEQLALLHYGISNRTIVAAARNGRLRLLGLEKFHLEHAFAIRSLLPSWVGVPTWRCEGKESGDPTKGEWQLAASELGPRLAHASLWHGTAVNSTPRQERRLAGAEVQKLGHVGPDERTLNFGLQPYLSWLEEDAELAQQVADAWNVVLEYGDGYDVPFCPCNRCSRRRDEERRGRSSNVEVDIFAR